TMLHFINYCNNWRSTEFEDSPGNLQKQMEPTIQNINLMVKLGANVNAVTAKGMTPLHYAALTDNAAYAECLLKNGANKKITNKNNETPIDLARKYGSKKTIELLKK
ncbi:MAG: ankyrin repeat domain-containing protein, partial [Firmicutes bacterium]|nr:ankyrin repeat domain-containing protein [Bacillota bacterium]